MSDDALMRWEWEGGISTSVGEHEDALDAEPSENATALPTASEHLTIEADRVGVPPAPDTGASNV